MVCDKGSDCLNGGHSVHSKLEINIPKFKMEESYALHEILPDMGFTNLFSGSANLTKLSKDQGLKVSEVSLQLHACAFQSATFPFSNVFK